ncbi:uncharacterized protein LOC143435551 [Arvicanthis niloticus]|uniref:uncharacterized protein LOC143435551 n=1 Tax=Arvicanthis niloticus TaxID=61156 RepID=UPI00403C8040
MERAVLQDDWLKRAQVSISSVITSAHHGTSQEVRPSLTESRLSAEAFQKTCTLHRTFKDFVVLVYRSHRQGYESENLVNKAYLRFSGSLLWTLFILKEVRVLPADEEGERSLLRRIRAEATRYHPELTEPTEPTAALLLHEQMDDSAQVSTPEPVPPCSGSESACNRDVATSELVPNEEMNTSEPVPNEDETNSELVPNADLASGEGVPDGELASSEPVPKGDMGSSKDLRNITEPGSRS